MSHRPHAPHNNHNLSGDSLLEDDSSKIIGASLGGFINSNLSTICFNSSSSSTFKICSGSMTCMEAAKGAARRRNYSTAMMYLRDYSSGDLFFKTAAAFPSS